MAAIKEHLAKVKEEEERKRREEEEAERLEQERIQKLEEQVCQVVCLLGEILSLPPFSCSCYLKICVCGHALCIVDSKILF